MRSTARWTITFFYTPCGGFGTFGLYGTALLGSTDRDSLNVDLLPSLAERINDFVHDDLFLATDAPTLVWQPLLDWLHGVRTSRPTSERFSPGTPSPCEGGAL